MARKYFLVLSIAALFVSAATGSAWSAEEPKAAPESEPELVIVKYGSLSVKCSEPGCKVYVDDNSKGNGDSIIEGIVVGEHVISCKTDDKAVSGTFAIKKNETLRLEANFNEGKLIHMRESARPEKGPEAVVEKKKPDPKKPEPKKPEPKKAEQKNPAEERRDLHLNVFKIEFKDRHTEDVAIAARANPKIITNYAESRGKTGKFYRTKQGLLLCEAGPCVQEWTTKFFYTDESGKRDSFLITWKQSVFSGMTPTGTSNRELTWCLNGACKKVIDIDTSDAPVSAELGPYSLTWTKVSAIFRRSDLMKDILDAGGTLPE